MNVFPQIKGEVTHDTSTSTPSEGFGLNAKLSPEKLDAAWTFINFYCGAEGAAIRAKYGEVPSYKLDLSKVAMALYLYQQTFTFANYGYGSAVSIIIVILSVGLISLSNALYAKAQKKIN